MEYLRDLRIKAGVSQQVVADYLGITRQAYSNYENGSRTPDLETLLKLAEYFNVSVDAVLRGPERLSESGEMDDDALKFALWGDTSDIDDADLEDVKRYAAFVQERKRNKRP